MKIIKFKLKNFEIFKKLFLEHIKNILNLELTENNFLLDDCVKQQNDKKLIQLYYKSNIPLKSDFYKKIVDDYFFVKKAYLTENWHKNWISKIKNIFNSYHIDPIISFTEEEKNPIDNSPKESFTEYVTKNIHIIKSQLGVLDYMNYSPITTPTNCYEILNYKEGDSPYNLKESFFLSKDLVITSHLTHCYVIDKLKKNYKENTISYNKCYRRENPDKTHLCEFHQLELQTKAKTSDPSKELKEEFLKICVILGLDPNYIEFRMTYYPYVSPAYEIYYTKNNNFIEIGGCGIMLNSVIKNQDLYLAGAIGLERCYSLCYNLKTINQVHPNIHK